MLGGSPARRLGFNSPATAATAHDPIVRVADRLLLPLSEGTAKKARELYNTLTARKAQHSLPAGCAQYLDFLALDLAMGM